MVIFQILTASSLLLILSIFEIQPTRADVRPAVAERTLPRSPEDYWELIRNADSTVQELPAGDGK